MKLISNGLVSCPGSCPSQTFHDSASDTCVTCSVNCTDCTSATACTSCSAGNALYYGYCLNTCPSGTTSDSGLCKSCLSGCKVCSSLTDCTLCQVGLTANANGTCTQGPTTVNCSNGYYEDSRGNCSQCFPSCQTCSGGGASSCLSCFSGSSLVDGVCETQCNADYFYNTSSSSCQKCDSVYADCIACNMTQCTLCASN